MQSFKKVWILYTSVLSLFLGVLFFCLSKNVLLEDQQADKPFFQIVFMAIFFAPIVEEILFRGYFSNKNVLKWVSISLLPIFILLTSPHYLSIISLLFLYGFLVLNIFFKNEFIENIQIILSSILFSTIHFKISDFNHVFSIYPVMVIFSLGLIAIWITLNFGLLKAIYFHSIWNLGVMLIIFFALQYPDLTKERFENEVIKMEWERSPIINNNKNGISYSKDKVIASNVTLNNLLNFLKQVEKCDCSFGEYYQSEVFMKYNLNIYLKDSSNNYSKSIIKYFQNEGLIKIKTN